MSGRGIAWLFVALTVAFASRAQAQAPPNIVLIVSDDHGWRDYGFMGSRQVHTPNLDRLSRESLTFRRGYVPSSLCCPSLAALITGKYPHQNKITSNDPPKPEGMSQGEFQRSRLFRDGRERMNRHLEDVPTMPKLLAQKGYLSLQTGKWWQGDFRRGGFTDGMTKGDRHGDEGLKIGRSTMQPISDFISQAKQVNKPFFVWYAPMLPHSPHNPPERLLQKYRKQGASIHEARYHAMVEWFDESIGELFKILDEQDATRNTIVVYLADNGWTQDPKGVGSVRSKLTPYDAGLRTPIMIKWPGKVTPRVSDQPVLSIDILPTLLSAVGMKQAGLSGLDLLDDKAVTARTTIFGECFTHNSVDLDKPAKSLLYRWANDGRWKLIVPSNPAVPVELYDVAADAGETKNLAKDNAETVAELRRKLDGWWNPAAE